MFSQGEFYLGAFFFNKKNVNLFSADPRFRFPFFPNKFALASVIYSKSLLDEGRKNKRGYFSSLSHDGMF